MFTVNDDLSIYVTRGDMVFLKVTAENKGEPYTFNPGDVVRFKVFRKKDCKEVVLQKDFPVAVATQEVEVVLEERDTKIGEVISKPVDYWYEVELNPDKEAKTIIGYDEDGAKVFKLFPEGRHLTEDDPIIQPEDIPVVDESLDLNSKRPVENRAVARKIIHLQAAFDSTKADITAKSEATAKVANENKARLDNLIAHDDINSVSQSLEYLGFITEATKAKIDGVITSDGAYATVKVNLREANLIYGGTTMAVFVIPDECRPIDTGLIHTEDGLEYKIDYDTANKHYTLSLTAKSDVTVAPSGAGSVTMTYALGDYELKDIRVGADGKTYASAGEAVRRQLEDMRAALLPHVSPQMFGAVGDGVVDDTKAIQAALTFAETSPQHAVYFPTGVYKVSGRGTIFSSKFVSLTGDNAVIYVAEGDVETDLFTFAGTSVNHNGKISGLEFSYKSNDYTMIRHVFNFVFEQDSDILYNLQVTNCLFRKNSGYKIYTDGWTNGGFNNCKFNDNIVYGLFIKSLSFGDSNKINGNSLYGSEESQLGDYVINLIQTSGSAGCEVSSNNCTSGLGYFEGFKNLFMSANQVENSEQTELDYLLKINLGNGVTVENCNFNAHGNSNLVYANIINCILRNCNFYGTKDGGYVVSNDNAHITFVENPRYFDGTTVYYTLLGKTVNGYATNTLYDDDRATFHIDTALNLHYLPKITNTVNLAPLKCAVNTTEDVYQPVEVVDGSLVSLRIKNKYQLYAPQLFNIPAILPVEHY